MLDVFERYGRRGGILAIFAGALVAAAGIVYLTVLFPEDAPVFTPIGTALGVGVILAGVVLAIVGVSLMMRPSFDANATPQPRSDRAEKLLAELASREKPFYVCVQCTRAFSPEECNGACPRCNSIAQCLEVESDDDLQMVRSALQ